jgi:NlpC/P60 family putative phage cell wall peptidase
VSVEKSDIVAEARTWIGTPFQHQGRTKGKGVDCIGLLYGVAKNLGIAPDIKSLPQEYIGYKRIPENGRLQAALNTYMEPIRMSQVGPGDVLLFAYKIGQPQHVAIYTGDTLIHAYNKKCTEHSMSAAWRRRLCGAYRFKCN